MMAGIRAVAELTKCSAHANLVLIRHGTSSANAEGKFGGWEDVSLTARGVDQARAAGTLLKASGFAADVAFSSVLRRATWTLWHTLDALDQCWVPVSHDWRLNERHYGALQGMSKLDAAKQYGATQVQTWRRDFWARPPRVGDDEHRRCLQDPRYRSLHPEQMPYSESLSDTVARVGACWRERIEPRIATGERVLVVAHGNSIRALLALLLRLEEPAIKQLEIPNGIPLLFRHTGVEGLERVQW